MDFETLAHYRILGRLGRGGMGVVYRAEDNRLGRQVALKVLNDAVANDPEKRRRFFHEARAAAALNHPNIATIHAVEEDRGTLLLVMEYIEGQTLDQLVRREEGRLSLAPDRAVDITAQVAAALEAAHRRGIVHRDIKSSNIMLARDGRLKVLDFGIAKIEGGELETQEGAVVGTLDYMSPEQAKGEPVDHRTDLWSLGVVLHELLTGRLPFEAQSRSAVLYKIVNVDPEIFTSTPSHIAASLVRILKRTLMKDRDLRYRSAAELERHLRSWDGEPRLASTTTTRFDRDPATVSYMTEPRISTRGRGAMSTAERRQITFLHCELGYRNATAQDQDPEEFAAALRQYRAVCAQVVRRYEGHLPGWTNNSAVVYFGYPVAHEDDTNRAIHAGLEILEQSRTEIAGDQTPYEVRLGVSTRLAIVESPYGGKTSASDSVIGEGATVARALAQMGERSGLLLESESQRLAATSFEYRSLGQRRVPEVSGQINVYELLAKAPDRRRFSGDLPINLTPLAGRTQEVELLMSRWNEALHSNGQVVLVSGSAGMGKSRLIHELKDRVAIGTKPFCVECFCSPYYNSSALYPVLNFIEHRYLENGAGKLTNAESVIRLGALLDDFGLERLTYLPVLAPLLSITPTNEYGSSELTSDRQRTLAMEALLSVLLENAARQPTLLIVEDVHWADPSTIELIGMLIDYLPGLPVLAVLTHRSEFVPPWTARGHLSTVSVNRLAREDVIALATAVAGKEHLPPAILEQVVRNADGVPLFVEELAKMIAESGLAEQQSQTGIPATKLAIPNTLRDSFMARLDRLGEAKRLAQIASVLGREFPGRLLTSIAEMDEDELRESMNVLVEAEVLYRRGTQFKPSYAFKHALLQEAAYGSLVKKDRVALHTAAGRALEQDPEMIERQPELAAYHFQEAGSLPEAIRYWHQSGTRALHRSAHREAIAAFRGALKLRLLLPDGANADETELLLVTSLGPSLIATMGFGAEEVGQNFDRARELCVSRNDSALLLPALFGIWLYKLVKGDLQSAGEVAEQLVLTGEANADDDMRIEGYWALGDVQFWQGRLNSARQNFEKTVALYDADRFHAHAHQFTQDPAVAAECYLSFTLMLQGEMEAAWHASERALSLARRLKHSFTIGWALGFLPTLSYFADDPVRAIEHADRAIAYCAEEAYLFWITSCQAVKGWALCRQGRCQEGLELVRTALAGMNIIGSELIIPLFTGLLAESLRLAGDADAALLTVQEGIAHAISLGTRCSLIDLHRIHGDVLLTRAEPDLTAARSCFERSAVLAAECNAVRFHQVATDRLLQIDSGTAQNSCMARNSSLGG